MDLLHEFTVPTDPDAAMALLRDVQRLAPCMPGAVLESVDGDGFAGSMKLKVGAVQLTYRGTGAILPSVDAHELPLQFSATEAKGAGGASAQVTCRVAPDPQGSRVSVATRLDITGKPAQFGRGVISEIGDRVVGTFADNVAKLLSQDQGPGASHPHSGAPVAAEPLDVMSVAGPVLLRRVLPGITGGVGVVLGMLLGVAVARRWGRNQVSR